MSPRAVSDHPITIGKAKDSKARVCVNGSHVRESEFRFEAVG